MHVPYQNFNASKERKIALLHSGRSLNKYNFITANRTSITVYYKSIDEYITAIDEFSGVISNRGTMNRSLYRHIEPINVYMEDWLDPETCHPYVLRDKHLWYQASIGKLIISLSDKELSKEMQDYYTRIAGPIFKQSRLWNICLYNYKGG